MLLRRRGEIERAFLRFAGGAGCGDAFRVLAGCSAKQRGAAARRTSGAAVVEQRAGRAGDGLAVFDGPDDDRGCGTICTDGVHAGAAAERPRTSALGPRRVCDAADGRNCRAPGLCACSQQNGSWKNAREAHKPRWPGRNWFLHCCETAGWPHPEGSGRSLAQRGISGAAPMATGVDECASLGFDGRRMSWSEFLEALGRALDETLFAPESHDAPIQIAGPAESAGSDGGRCVGDWARATMRGRRAAP